MRSAPISTCFPYTTLFRSEQKEDANLLSGGGSDVDDVVDCHSLASPEQTCEEGSRQNRHRADAENPDHVDGRIAIDRPEVNPDRKSTCLNSSHLGISYAVF